MVLGGKIENNSSRLGVLFEIQSTEDKLTKIFSLFLEVQPSLITWYSKTARDFTWHPSEQRIDIFLDK